MCFFLMFIKMYKLFIQFYLLFVLNVCLEVEYIEINRYYYVRLLIIGLFIFIFFINVNAIFFNWYFKVKCNYLKCYHFDEYNNILRRKNITNVTHLGVTTVSKI